MLCGRKWPEPKWLTAFNAWTFVLRNFEEDD
jgi:hypothetical protein